MRVRMLVVAMIATPLLASVSHAQSTVGDRQAKNKGEHVNSRYKICEKLSPSKSRPDDANSSTERREPKKCAPVGPPPVTPPTGGVAEVHGLVFSDLNGNGVYDVGEVPLAGRQVLLTGTVSATVTTGADGTYIFASLPVGLYTVCSAGGLTQTAPLSGPACASGSPGYAVEIPVALPDIWYLDIDFALR